MGALYICPATQGAMVAAAPALTKRGSETITRVLIIRGVRDCSNPTGFERTEAIRPEIYLRGFFEEMGLEVAPSVDVPPQDFAGALEVLRRHLTAENLDGIDSILLNGQAGTKQMSSATWDAIQPSTGGGTPNLALTRCFVGQGTVEFDDGRRLSVPPLSVAKHLRLYGYEEIDAEGSIAAEAWMRKNHDAILSYGMAWRASDYRGKRKAVAVLRRRDESAPLLADFEEKGVWLEGLAYLLALDMRTPARSDRKVRARLKVRDMDADPLPTFDGGVQNHHEIDLAVTGPGALHLVECKAGPVTQDNVNKLDSLRNRLQGRNGVTAIISRKAASLDDILGQKAYSARITWESYIGDGLERVISRIFA